MKDKAGSERHGDQGAGKRFGKKRDESAFSERKKKKLDPRFRGDDGGEKGKRTEKPGARFRRDDKDKSGKRPEKRGGGQTRRPSSSARVVGMVVRERGGYCVRPSDRRDKNYYEIRPAKDAAAHLHHLVVGRVSSGSSWTRKIVEIESDLGDPNDPRNFTAIAIHAHEIPDSFPSDVVSEAKSCKPVELGKREDLRKMQLVTIDGEDSRDFDDAVHAEPDGNGWKLTVAIADVAHYVPFGSALNREALARGNSTYFPDRAVPMLPEELSNDLCSLRPLRERACMAVHMWIDQAGEITRWQFVRGLMKSAARLTYTQVQKAIEGQTDDVTGPLLETVIRPLYGAFHTLMKARLARGTLELNLSERKILLNDDGSIKGIVERASLDSHKLIEEFMIAANVCAAAQLEGKAGLCLYRVHDRPSEIKLEALRDFLDGLGIRLMKGSDLHPRMLTHILENAAGTPHAEVVNEMILRTQSQAVYSPDNIGHFGLALAKYAHFTSPIRRYADLMVHRALIRVCGFGEDGITEDEIKDLADIGTHISGTERRSVIAERDVVDRYTAYYLVPFIGKTYPARVSGIGRHGLFARLNDIGADGIIPFANMPRDYYRFDEKNNVLIGERHGLCYRLGDPITARLEKVDPLTGSMVMALARDGKEKTEKVKDQAYSPKKAFRPRDEETKKKKRR